MFKRILTLFAIISTQSHSFLHHFRFNGAVTSRNVSPLRKSDAFGFNQFKASKDEESEEEVEYFEELENDDEEQEQKAIKIAEQARLKVASRNFQSFGWFAWWTQTILTTISGVILLFSNAITERSVRGNALQNGVLLAGLGVMSSFISVFWTWRVIRIALNWGKKSMNKITPFEAQRQITRTLKIGAWINLVGMLFSLIGAEQIVGTLVAKILYVGGVGSGQVVTNAIPSTQQIRALDIFVIQANTNSLLSHYVSLAFNLFLVLKAKSITKKND
mmetsp:Transcript_17375/g.25762  ORF Transcript_17375/g.25762 Transcript_17375/m.25762 type:complete len:275 (-) Transcript_17375:62-886(-)|eukprot:CAMPEP_0171464542 /NCGR_PEP_ID=MMETSP0945-20130129/7826_1 /TAXON_ID=109269 /ORGANISM="Vaucheria litorea, Strain CCMP2940" /LENGTH=274 /DNA_ID=CAMNT_0011991665 /DNA_START=20 /DNA_END=844 /DNA_ORIENTATION=-